MRSYAALVRAALLVLGALLLPAHHVMGADQPAMAPAAPLLPPPANGISMPPSPANNSDISPSPSQVPPPVVYPYVIVEGMIYCKTCNYSGYNVGMNASPLKGLHPPDPSYIWLDISLQLRVS
jgi:hypothetical protein